MAGSRLEMWSTLAKDELQLRISAEEDRLMSLSFEETQLLDAARERLRSWRAPNRTKGRATMQQEKDTNTAQTTDAVAKVAEKTETAAKPAATEKTEAAPAAAETAKPAKAAPAKKATAKPAAKAAPAAQAKSTQKESTVSKTAKKPAKAAKAKKETGKRVSEDAVLRVNKSWKNPFKEGSGPYKRFEIVAKSAGKTYGALRAMASLKPTTALNFVRAGGGHFEGK